MQKFCHNCGKQLDVGAKFCSGCGTNLSSLAATVPPAPIPAQPQRQTFTPFALRNEEEVIDVDRLEHLDIRINKLDFDFTTQKHGAESVGAVMTQGRTIGNPDMPPREGNSITDPKAFLEDFRKEAGAHKPNERTRSVEVTS